MEEKQRRWNAMSKNYINIGNKAFISEEKVICIVAANSDKVRRILDRANLKRTDPDVIDTTSDKETRSIIYLDENKYCVSSVNASVLAKRAQSDTSELID